MKKNLFLRTLVSILVTAGGLANSMQATTPNFDVNDVSWLFPFPKEENINALISMEALKTADGQLLWPKSAFEELLVIADGKDAAIQDGPRINLPAEVRQMSAWKIAGVRFDPSAPGTAPKIIDEFGSDPQIRLILQPVTGTLTKTHDITVHVIYSFSKPEDGPIKSNTFPKAVPDEMAFLEVVKDLAEVKSLATELGAATSGQELGVHPGLDSPTASTEVSKLMKNALIKHLSRGKLRAMAIMGLPNEFEPWIFVAITLKDGKYIAAPGFTMPSLELKAQAISFVPPKGVFPTPVANNRAPIINQINVPLEQRRGVSTAVLFQTGLNLAAKAEIARKGDDGNPDFDKEATNGEIVDIIANPTRSHFFNTDCVSCHTETTRAGILNIKPGNLAFKAVDLSKLRDKVTPKSQWNVRNFGWGPPREPIATVSRRAFNETAESAAFINNNYLPKLPPSGDQESLRSNQ